MANPTTIEISPLAPKKFPNIKPVPGLRLCGQAVGLKSSGDKDLMIAELVKGTKIAGVMTNSRCPSAPVDWCRTILPEGRARAIIVNSGNANAFTGASGNKVVTSTVSRASKLFNCNPNEVYIASTGVIGEPLLEDQIAEKLSKVVTRLSPTSWKSASEAIMTTDTFAKAASVKTKIGSSEVVISGFAKGSGMIAPDMSTMLGFIFTNARLPAQVLQRLLRRAADSSFNSITVDGDTSTSDTLFLCATGKNARQKRILKSNDPDLKEFYNALESVCLNLANQIVSDGEGARKLITLNVSGAESKRAARNIGLSVANSPLVKTAVAGEDPNWGRIIMAVGKAGEKADRDKLSINIGGIPITHKGERSIDYNEAIVASYMKNKNIEISLDVGVGRSKATVWTCDLTHKYISINADYRS